MLQTVPATPTDKQHPYLKSASVQWGRVIADVSNQMWCSVSEARALEVLPGDLLVCEGGDVGRAALYSGPNGFVFQNSLHRVRSRDGSDLRYLYYLLSALHASNWLDVICNKATIRHFTSEKVATLEIPIPPPEEQRRIADFLDAETSRIDQMIVITDAQQAALKERMTEEIRQATTVGSGAGKPTGLSWMPLMNENWRLAKVGHEFLTGSGTTPRSVDESYFDGPNPWVNSGDLNDGTVMTTSKFLSDRALADYSALKVHRAGALVVAMYGQGETKGRTGILGIGACVNQACCVLEPIGGVSVQFAQFWFRAHKQGVVAMAMGAGQPNLSQELLRQVRMPVPGLAEQHAIVRDLEVSERQVGAQATLLQSRVRLLAERRQALITAAVTGQFDVSTASGRNTTQGV
ncbi:restriction endonuclease subunit S [Nocardia cyriacigeorgica]